MSLGWLKWTQQQHNTEFKNFQVPFQELFWGFSYIGSFQILPSSSGHIIGNEPFSPCSLGSYHACIFNRKEERHQALDLPLN